MRFYSHSSHLAQEWIDKTLMPSFGNDEGLLKSTMGTWWWGEFLWMKPPLLNVVVLSIHICFNPFSPSYRTKRFLSDDGWQPKTTLMLPASVARSVHGNIPPGWASSGLGKWGSTGIDHCGDHCDFGSLWLKFQFIPLPVFLEKSFNENSDENKTLRKFASTMRPGLNLWNFTFSFFLGDYVVAIRSRTFLVELHSWRSGESVYGYLWWTLCGCILVHGSVNNLWDKFENLCH